MKTKKNGGMIKREPDCLDVCRLLDCNSSTDCVAGSLLLLEYCDFDTSSYLAKRSPNGVWHEDILRMYQIAYDPDATLVKIDDLTDEAITAILPPSFATILCYNWSKNGQDYGHAVVLFNNGGTLKILDPQKCKVRDRSACSVDLSKHKRKGQTRTNYTRTNYQMIKSKETSERFKIDKYVIDLVLNKNIYEYPGAVDVIHTRLSPEDVINKAYIVEGIIEKLGSWDKRIYDIEGVGDVNIETEREKILNRAQENIKVKRKRKNDEQSQTKRRIKLVFKKAPNEPLSRTATEKEIDRDIEESLANDEFISDLTEEENIKVKRKRKNDEQSQTKRRIKLVLKKAPNEPLSRTATEKEIDRDIAESLANDEFISDLTEEELRQRPDTRELTQEEFDEDLFKAYAEDDAISDLSKEKLDDTTTFRNHGGKKHTRRRSKQFK